jgi:hypothetical protein
MAPGRAVSAEDLAAYLDYDEETEPGAGAAPPGAAAAATGAAALGLRAGESGTVAAGVSSAGGGAVGAVAAAAAGGAAAGPAAGATATAAAGGASSAPASAGKSAAVTATATAAAGGALRGGDLESLLDALAQPGSSPAVAAPAPAPVLLAAAATREALTGAHASRTILLTQLLPTQAAEDKLRQHLERYGLVEWVHIEGSCALVRFGDKGGAQRAFLNRAPVLKDDAIQLFRVEDLEPGSRLPGVSEPGVLRCPNRKSVVRSGEAAPAELGPGTGAAAPTALPSSPEVPKAVSLAPVTPGQLSAGRPPGSSSGAGSGAASGLYGDIDLSGGPRRRSSVAGDAKAAAASAPAAAAATPAAAGGVPPALAAPGSDPRASAEKRTWSRAGLANMNDKEVLRAKQQEKVALQQIKVANETVAELKEQLDKQKQQFALVGSDSKTIGANLRMELMSNISVLMMQMRQSQATMAAAKAALARAKKQVEVAIEQSKTRDSADAACAGASSSSAAASSATEADDAAAAPAVDDVDAAAAAADSSMTESASSSAAAGVSSSLGSASSEAGPADALE